MARVRVAGPRPELPRVLAVLQDLSVMHVVAPPVQGHAPPAPPRACAHLRSILADADAALLALGPATEAPQAVPATDGGLPRAARRARRIRREAERAARRVAGLQDERALLLRYREFFSVFAPLLGHELAWPDGRAFYVVLRKGAADAVEPLRRRLEDAVSGEIELLARPLSGGETAVLLLASKDAAPVVSRLLSDARVQELPAPSGLSETNLLRALPVLQARLRVIPSEIAAARAALASLLRAHGAWLQRLRAEMHDRLLLRQAEEQVAVSEHLFILEGYLPSRRVPLLLQRAAADLGPECVVQDLGAESWTREDAPVALQNPPLFRPFEIVTRMVPLPRYGTIDPTPFVAVFFPMFFGIMLGDAGYGALLLALALVLRARSQPGSTLRQAATVAGACGAFAVLFGLVFGEVFGTLGRHAGLQPLGFDREKAIVPFLAVAVALGVVHVVLGLVLAVVGAWRTGHRRHAMGRGAAALMVALTAVAALAALEVLPRTLFSPLAVGVLVAFVLVIAMEGVIAVVELISTFGRVLSYARIMALGTASLMLAVVANEMAGAMGSVAVGVLFALLFHLVNFAIGLFSPAIHALRLHYLEFFGTFFSPGGTPYRPLAHWRPARPGA